MPATVTVEAFTGQDEYTAPTYGPVRSYRARDFDEITRITDRFGAEVISTCQVWLATVDDINEEDRLILPDGSQGHILRVQTVPDENGPHHVKLYLK